MDAIIGLFQELEILTPRWSERLAHPALGPWDKRTLALARYFVQRYWLQAVSDYDLYSRVKFACLACVLIKGLGGDFLSTAQLFSKEIENDADNLDTLLDAQLFSKEIENDADNLDTLLDAAYTHPACTDDKLLGLLLG